MQSGSSFFNSLAGKLIAGFSVIVLLLLIEGGVGIYLTSSEHTANQRRMAEIADLQNLREAINALRLGAFEFLGTTNPPQMDKLKASINAQIEQLSATSGWPKSGAEQFAASAQTYREIIQSHYDFQTKKAYALIYDRSQTEFNQLMKTISTQLAALQAHAEADAEASQSSTVMLTLALVIAGSLFAGVIALLLSRSIVGAIADAQAVLASGDFSRMLKSERNDEIGDLTRTVGEMSNQLRTTINGIRERTLALTDASTQVAEIARKANSVVEEERVGTREVSSSVSSMMSAMQLVSQNARTAASAADDAGHESNRGKQVVQENLKALRDLTQAVEKATEVIDVLARESGNIGKVLSVIRGIAEQTNLLALNAAIEAARAGEQGRGFAVVADEVRTLASRTQQSTQEINEMIARLQAGSAQAVSVMLESRDQAHAGLNHAERSGQALDTITQSITAIIDMNQQIAAEAESQMAVTEAVNRSISQIAHLADTAAEGAAQTAQKGEYMARLAKEMQNLVAQFKV